MSDREVLGDPTPYSYFLGGVFSIESLVVVLASWTVGYWVAIAFGGGWVFALPIAGIALVGFGRWVHPGRGRDADAYEPASGENAQIAFVLAVAVLWPVLFDAGRVLIGAVAVALLVARLSITRWRREPREADARLVVMGSVAIGVGLAATASWTWGTGLVVAVGATVALRPSIVDRLSAPMRVHVPSTDDPAVGPVDTHRSRVINTLLLAAFGAIFAIWIAGFGPFWNGDNSYHLNKAEHYAANPTRWVPEDLMYGVDGLDHFPYINFLSSYEGLVGLLGRVTGQSAFDTLFVFVVPLVMFAIPFVVRFAARGVGIQRAGLAGAIAAATFMISPSIGTNLFASASIGKAIGPLLFAPVLIGAAGMLVRVRSARAAAFLVAAVIALVSTSPSHSMSASILLGGFCSAAAIALLPDFRERERRSGALRSLAIVMAPLGFTLGYALFARVFQGQADPIQQQVARIFGFDDSEDAWRRGVTEGPGPDHWLTYLLVLGGVGVVAIALREQELRRAWGIAVALLYLLMLPVVFDHVIDELLDLRPFSWRLFAVFSAPAIIGIASSALDRSRYAIFTLGAVVIAIGLSGPTLAQTQFVFLRPQAARVWEPPVTWFSERGAHEHEIESARAVLTATPEDGRFLAPAIVEEVAMAIDIDRFPTYARRQFIRSFAGDAGTPAEFMGSERLLLYRAMTARAGDATTEADLRRALRVVAVDAVCVDDQADERLVAALVSDYVESPPTPLCDLWTIRLER